MMSFKEVMQEDVKGIFLNAFEFAETAKVNDIEMPIIVDGLEYHDREKFSLDKTERIYQKELMIYVPAEEFGKEPKNGSQLILQIGEKTQSYIVKNCLDEDGVYSITLQVYR